MKKLLNILIVILLLTSCNKGPRIVKHYDEETGEYVIDTLPFNDLRDFPKLQKAKNVDSLINEIKKEKYVFEKHFGLVGAYTEQYARFERLIELLNEKELFNLTKNEDPIIRVYAYKGLKIKRSRYLREVERVYKKDTAEFVHGSGCLIGSYKISEYIKFN